MVNTHILSIVTFIYLAAFICYVLSILFRKDFFSSAAIILAASGFTGHTAGIGWRWIESHKMGIGHAPLSNFYESLIFFAWTIVSLHLVLGRRKGLSDTGAFTMPTAFILMAWASFSPNINSQIEPLIPALKSNWLVSHVITCFLGYSAFVTASVFAFLTLKDFSGRRLRLPSKEILQTLTYRTVCLGFILFSIGIMTGSVWAYSAWGRYWGWDPKETWALITWLIYASLLHTRFTGGEKEKKVSILCLVGLASVLFTYFGVNYLPGLHSYL